MNNKNLVKMRIIEICGPHCVAIQDGENVYKKITENLDKDLFVRLDFTGINTLTSSFLNAAIGKLFGKYNIIELEKRLSWKGLDESDTQLINLVIENAKEYFSKEKEKRKIENGISNNFEEL